LLIFSALPAAQFLVLATGGSGARENDRRKEKQKSEKAWRAAHQVRLGKGIRRRNTILKFGGLFGFDMPICS